MYSTKYNDDLYIVVKPKLNNKKNKQRNKGCLFFSFRVRGTWCVVPKRKMVISFFFGVEDGGQGHYIHALTSSSCAHAMYAESLVR